jgi:hypothetical protein
MKGPRGRPGRAPVDQCHHVRVLVPMAEIFGHMRSFRERMAAGELVSGPFVSLTDPTASEALAGSVDFLWYDQEHTPMAPETLSSHLVACRTKRTPAFVRITGPNDGDHQPWCVRGSPSVHKPLLGCEFKSASD